MIKSSFQTYYKLFWLKDVFRIVSTCVRINIFIGLADEIVIVILWINIEWRLKIKLKGRCTHKKFYPQSGASLFFTVIPKRKKSLIEITITVLFIHSLIYDLKYLQQIFDGWQAQL